MWAGQTACGVIRLRIVKVEAPLSRMMPMPPRPLGVDSA